MPNYDFYCEKCGCQFEKYFDVNDDRKGLRCPKCRSKKVERYFGNISVGTPSGRGSKSSSDSCSSCGHHNCSSCGH